MSSKAKLLGDVCSPLGSLPKPTCPGGCHQDPDHGAQGCCRRAGPRARRASTTAAPEETLRLGQKGPKWVPSSQPGREAPSQLAASVRKAARGGRTPEGWGAPHGHVPVPSPTARRRPPGAQLSPRSPGVAPRPVMSLRVAQDPKAPGRTGRGTRARRQCHQPRHAASPATSSHRRPGQVHLWRLRGPRQDLLLPPLPRPFPPHPGLASPAPCCLRSTPELSHSTSCPRPPARHCHDGPPPGLLRHRRSPIPSPPQDALPPAAEGTAGEARLLPAPRWPWLPLMALLCSAVAASVVTWDPAAGGRHPRLGTRGRGR